MSQGAAYGLAAYFLWGLFPLYFQFLVGVGAFEIVLHRVVWSLAFLLVLLCALRRWQWLAPLARQPRVIGASAASALLLTANWTLYVWAVTNGRVIDASLGYFINPLVNVLLGAVFLRERLRPAQWLAVALAAAGVAWLALRGPQWPWVGLAIGFSFGFYGLLRKTAPLGAIEGLALETALLAPIALAILAFWTWQGTGGLAGHSDATLALLAGVGPVSAIPLLLFAAGARRVTMATLGLLQYVSPTLQMLLGVWFFGEPLTGDRLAGFVLIWIGLAIYSIEGVWRGRR